MQSETRAPLDDAALHPHVVRLLEADAVADDFYGVEFRTVGRQGQHMNAGG